MRKQLRELFAGFSFAFSLLLELPERNDPIVLAWQFSAIFGPMSPIKNNFSPTTNGLH